MTTYQIIKVIGIFVTCTIPIVTLVIAVLIEWRIRNSRTISEIKDETESSKKSIHNRVAEMKNEYKESCKSCKEKSKEKLEIINITLKQEYVRKEHLEDKYSDKEEFYSKLQTMVSDMQKNFVSNTTMEQVMERIMDKLDSMEKSINLQVGNIKEQFEVYKQMIGNNSSGDKKKSS